MKVKVKFFGMIAEATQVKEIELTDVSDSSVLIQMLLNTYPLMNNCKYAVALNKNLIEGVVVLNNNDEIAILPPFAGG